MANRNYNTSGIPTYGSQLLSSTIRSEFNAVSQGFTGIEAELDGKASTTTTQTLTNKTFQAVDGTVGAPSISFTSDTNTGFYRIGNDAVGFAVGGVKIAEFSGTTITANITGNVTGSSGSCTGNAVTATNATNHIADVSGSVHGATSNNTASMIVRRDGSGNFSAGTITATLSGNSTTSTNATNHIADTTGGVHGATSSNTASMIVRRDANGNFSAGTITASLTGNVTGNVTGSSGSCTGNAATATSVAVGGVPAASSSNFGGLKATLSGTTLTLATT